MKKGFSGKFLVFSVLFILTMSLSLGFATFSTTLSMDASASFLPQDGIYNVMFVSSVESSNVYSVDSIEGDSGEDDLEYNETIISDTTISNVGVSFTEPGQEIKYDFYILNRSRNTAYLTAAIFEDFDRNHGNIVCENANMNDTELEAVCESINLSLSLGETNSVNLNETSSINNYEIASRDYDFVELVVSYDEEGPVIASPVKVSVGDISLVYMTLSDDFAIGNISDPEYCYISTEPGEINYYRSDCARDVNIPDSLSLPTSSLNNITLNADKCVEYYHRYSDYEDEKIKTYCQDAKKYVDSDFDNNYKKSYLDQSIILAAMCDYDTTIVNSSKSLVNKVGDYAFYGKFITSIQSLGNVKIIGSNAFADNLIPSVSFNDLITSIGANSFSSNLITDLDFNDNIRLIEDGTFANNKIKNLNISDNIELIGENAFEYNLIESLTIPSTVNIIGKFAFAYNDISTLNIQNGLEEIKESAFNVNKLTSVSFPDSVTKIGSKAFDTNKISSVVFGSGITEIGSKAFGGSSITSVDDDYKGRGPNSVETVSINILEADKNSVSIADDAFSWNGEKDNSSIEWLVS